MVADIDGVPAAKAAAPARARESVNGMRAYRRLLGFLAALAGCIVAAVTLLVGINVVMRNTGAGSMAWLHETGEYALYAIGFLAAPWILHNGGHVAVDLVVQTLPSRARRWACAGANLAGAGLCLLLVVYGIGAARDAHAAGSYRLQELAVAEWWLLALMPVSATLMLVEFLIRLRRGTATNAPSSADGSGADAQTPGPPQGADGL